MANPLTSDFDVAIQLSEEMLQRYLILQYFSDTRLQKVDQSFDVEDVLVGSAKFKLLIPSLSLHIDRPVGVETFLQLVFPFEGTLNITEFTTPSLVGDHYLEGICTLSTPLVQLTAAGTVTVSFDFSSIEESALTVAFDNSAQSGSSEALLEEIFKQGIVAGLNEIGSISVLNLTTGEGDEDIRSIEVRTLNSSTPANQTCMALFLMITDDPQPAVNPNFSYFLKNDYSLAISPKIFNAEKVKSLTQELGIASLADLPAPLPTDSSTIVDSIDLTLGDGHVNFAAKITEKNKCLPDAVVYIASTVTFSVDADGNLVPEFAGFDTDLPWWIDILNAIVPIIGSWLYGLIWAITQRMVEGDLQDVGTFGNLSVFQNDLKLGEVQGYFPTSVANYGCDISLNGLVIFGDIFLYTFVGNKRSKELHNYSDSKWLSLMNDKYAVYHERYEDYITDGYNGCYYCLNQLNTG